MRSRSRAGRGPVSRAPPARLVPTVPPLGLVGCAGDALVQPARAVATVGLATTVKDVAPAASGGSSACGGASDESVAAGAGADGAGAGGEAGSESGCAGPGSGVAADDGSAGAVVAGGVAGAGGGMGALRDGSSSSGLT